MPTKLTGNRCKCAECGEFFNSAYAFDKHRVGAYETDPGRWCLSEFGMEALRMAKNLSGFWLSSVDRRTKHGFPPL